MLSPDLGWFSPKVWGCSAPRFGIINPNSAQPQWWVLGGFQCVWVSLPHTRGSLARGGYGRAGRGGPQATPTAKATPKATPTT